MKQYGKTMEEIMADDKSLYPQKTKAMQFINQIANE